MKPEENKPEPDKAILAKPEDGETKEEFIKKEPSNYSVSAG
jgi:hypothetical protein